MTEAILQVIEPDEVVTASQISERITKYGFDRGPHTIGPYIRWRMAGKYIEIIIDDSTPHRKKYRRLMK